MNKQHIVGIIIFTLIVGSAVVVGSFFIKMPDAKSVTVSDYDSYTFRSDTYCRRKKRKKRKERRPAEAASVKLNQAVFNLKTKKLNLDMFLQNADKSQYGFENVALYFFVNDKNGTRHLATEYTDISSDSSAKEMDSLNWLNNLQSHENLYVIPQVVDNDNDMSAYQPIFDESKATAILLRGIDNF